MTRTLMLTYRKRKEMVKGDSCFWLRWPDVGSDARRNCMAREHKLWRKRTDSLMGNRSSGLWKRSWLLRDVRVRIAASYNMRDYAR